MTSSSVVLHLDFRPGVDAALQAAIPFRPDPVLADFPVDAPLHLAQAGAEVKAFA